MRYSSLMMRIFVLTLLLVVLANVVESYLDDCPTPMRLCNTKMVESKETKTYYVPICPNCDTIKPEKEREKCVPYNYLCEKCKKIIKHQMKTSRHRAFFNCPGCSREWHRDFDATDGDSKKKKNSKKRKHETASHVSSKMRETVNGRESNKTP